MRMIGVSRRHPEIFCWHGRACNGDKLSLWRDTKLDLCTCIRLLRPAIARNDCNAQHAVRSRAVHSTASRVWQIKIAPGPAALTANLLRPAPLERCLESPGVGNSAARVPTAVAAPHSIMPAVALRGTADGGSRESGVGGTALMLKSGAARPVLERPGTIAQRAPRLRRMDVRT